MDYWREVDDLKPWKMKAPVILRTNESDFPDARLALSEPNGLLAIGGDLSPSRLIRAYKSGIFPWYNEGQPILWWSPDPRLVLFPKNIKISRSLAKSRRNAGISVSYNQAFIETIDCCANTLRKDQPGTWITDDMKQAYIDLHQLGYAHSVEAWNGDRLVGGLYGIAIGSIFFGESMFSAQRDASKIAFCQLVEDLESWGYQLIDCQVTTEHLISLGAEEIARDRFLSIVEQNIDREVSDHAWSTCHRWNP